MPNATPSATGSWNFLSKLGFGTQSTPPSATKSQPELPPRRKTVIEQSFSDAWSSFRQPVADLRDPLYWIRKMVSMGRRAWEYQTERYPTFVRWLTLPVIAVIGVILLTKLFVSLAVFYLAGFLPVRGLQALVKKGGAEPQERTLDDTVLHVSMTDIAHSAKQFWQKLTEKLPEHGKATAVISRVIIVLDAIKTLVIEPICLGVIPFVLTAGFAAVVGLICAPLEIKDWLSRSMSKRKATERQPAANDAVVNPPVQAPAPEEVAQNKSPVETPREEVTASWGDWIKLPRFN